MHDAGPAQPDQVDARRAVPVVLSDLFRPPRRFLSSFLVRVGEVDPSTDWTWRMDCTLRRDRHGRTAMPKDRVRRASSA